jgi:hypothetical protein
MYLCTVASLMSPVPLSVYLTSPAPEPGPGSVPEPEPGCVPAAPLSRQERRTWARLCRDLSTPVIPGEPPARKQTPG